MTRALGFFVFQTHYACANINVYMSLLFLSRYKKLLLVTNKKRSRVCSKKYTEFFVVSMNTNHWSSILSIKYNNICVKIFVFVGSLFFVYKDGNFVVKKKISIIYTLSRGCLSSKHMYIDINSRFYLFTKNFWIQLSDGKNKNKNWSYNYCIKYYKKGNMQNHYFFLCI